jgi:hypothetical protein
MENNEKQHLALIADMINIARKEYSDNSFIYLVWGWVVCLASLAEYVLLKMGKEYHPAVWLVMIPTAIVQIIMSARQNKRERVKTHMDKIIGYVWIAVGVSLGVVLCSMSVMQLSAYPVLILLYGIGTFVSGGIMNLKPMKIGAICCWVLGLVAFHVPFEYQLLLLSLSLILSYIIPGHLLKNRFSKNV